jgi:hypothetical protein
MMIAGPTGVKYARNPSENIVSPSKIDAANQIREVVQELQTNVVSVVVENGLQGALRGLFVAMGRNSSHGLLHFSGFACVESHIQS